MDLKPKNLFKRVIQFARGERPRLPRNASPSATRRDSLEADGVLSSASASGTEPPSKPQPEPAGTSEVRGLEVARKADGTGLVLRWAIHADDVSRAGALVTGQAVLCLRVVSFTKVRDDVLRDVQDRPGVDLVGECEIAEPSQRAIVALGVRVGDRFVSIAHHVV